MPNFELIRYALEILDINYNYGGTPYPTFDYETVFHNMTKLKTLRMNVNETKKFPFSAEHIQTNFPVLKLLHLSGNLIELMPNLTAWKKSNILILFW